jgi:hypothetical protein
MQNMKTLISQLRGERDRLDRAISALEGIGSNGRGGRTLSASARKRIAEAQRKRWAKARGEAIGGNGRRNRRVSAAGRRGIAAAQRARWAKANNQKQAA